MFDKFGMYVIYFFVVDNVGNRKIIRRFVLFDDFLEVIFNYKGFIFVEMVLV